MITYDDSGYNHAEADLLAEYTKIKERVFGIQNRSSYEGYDFLSLPEDVLNQTKLVEIGSQLKQKYDTALIIGIGGSDLGAKAISQALLHPIHNFLPKDHRSGMRLLFCGNSADPDDFLSVCETIDWKSTVVVPVSKSGGTLEILSALFAILPHVPSPAQVVAVTGTSGILADLARQNTWQTLPFPETVGGRYSVLSASGLFPLYLAGININQLCAGAKEMLARVKTEGQQHPAVLFALHHYIAEIDNQQNIAVLLPYKENLFNIGQWWRQLWAESLGKRGRGQTPIVSVMPTDQHSQAQLYSEGPDDKIYTFMNIEKPKREQALPANFPPDYAYLNNRKMSEVQHALYEGAKKALMEKNRPVGTITLSELNEENIGGLIMMLEIATVLTADLSGVNAFDQPSVERGKILTKEILNIK